MAAFRIYFLCCMISFGIVALLTLPNNAARAEPQLAQRVLLDMRKTPGARNAELFDEKTIKIKTNSGETFQINLDNLIEETKHATAGDHPQIYKRYLAAYRFAFHRMHHAAKPFDQKKLVLIVRNQDYLSHATGLAEGSQRRSITSSLNVFLAVNEANTISTFGGSQMQTSNLTADSAERLANSNLDRIANRVRVHRLRSGLSVWATQLDRDLESSLILSPKFLAKAVATANGPVVVGVPERGMLLFASANDPMAISLLEGTVRKLHSEALGNRQLSADILYSDGGPVRPR
jgi:uncharacterized protein YtpQ (UPF0354 family)